MKRLSSRLEVALATAQMQNSEIVAVPIETVRDAVSFIRKAETLCDEWEALHPGTLAESGQSDGGVD